MTNIDSADIAPTDTWHSATRWRRTMQLGMIGLGRMGANMVRRLLRAKHRCVVFDDHAEPGGTMRHGVAEADLPRAVLDADATRLAACPASSERKSSRARSAAFKLRAASTGSPPMRMSIFTIGETHEPARW